MAEIIQNDDLDAPRSTRRTLLMVAASVVLVLLAYSIIILIGGQALTGLPFARQIQRIGGLVGVGEVTVGPIPALQAPVVGPSPTPSPVVAPSPSPSFIPPEPDAPSTLTFTLEYVNDTGVRLTGVRITSPIPAATFYESGSAVPDAAFNGKQLVWTIGILDPGQTGQVSFRVLTTKKGSITNKAVLSSNEAPSSEVESSASVS